MNRKKHFLLILVALVLSFTLTFSLIACDRNTGDPNENVTDEKALIANGTFAGVESETYPKVPSNWSAAAGSTGSQATPSVQGEDIVSGVINVDTKIFKDNASKWKLPKDQNPGKPNNDSKDNNILMINNISNTSYRYNSSSISIEKGSYYKVTMNVMTRGNSEAFIYVLSDAFAEFRHIKTDNQWRPFEVYIEGAENVSKSIQISLSNGWGDKNGVLSTGAVFFDEIKVEKLTDDKDKDFGKKEYDKQVQLDKNYDNNIATYSMKKPDTEFNYTSGTIQPYSPSKYRGQPGSTEGSSNAPSASSYVSHGVLDTKDPGLSELNLEGVELCPNTLGTKMLYIHNIERTAYGYRSSVPFVIKAGKVYNFSVSLKTVGITGNGATLRLIESATDKEKKNQISDIKPDTWTNYSFTITGDNLSDKEIFFELWLGEGGLSEEDKWTKGTVYMDNIAFAEADTSSEVSLASDSTHLDVSYAKDIDVAGNKIDNGYIMGDGENGWYEKTVNDKNYNFNNANFDNVYHSVVKDNVDGKRIPLPADNLVIKNGTTNSILDTALNIHIGTRSAYSVVIKNGTANLALAQNSYQKYTMWVKTDLDEKFDAQGLNVSLMKKAKKADEDDTAVATFTNINTRKIEKNNGYVELTFYVEGSNKEANELYLEVMLGSGSRFTADTQVVGDAYITLVGMEIISHDDYVKASTGTYIKKNSLATAESTSAKIANGNFTESDINATYDNYIKHQGNKAAENEEEVIAKILKNGEFVVPTAPTSWSISNKAYLEALTTGVVKSADQFTNIEDSVLKNDLISLISGAKGGSLVISTKTKSSGEGALTAPTSPDTCGCTCEDCKKAGVCTGSCKGVDGKPCECLHNKKTGVLPVGYSSSSISLDANSFYRISVQVKAIRGIANVTLNSKQDESIKVNADNTKEWQTVTFYVNTGLSATNVKLELYLGDKGSKESIEGAVAFDNATYWKITDEKEYKKAIENMDEYSSKVEFLTDTFTVENPSEDKLSSPGSSWSGNTVSEGSTKDTDLVSGVFDKNYTRSEWLKTTDKDGNNTYLRGDVYDYLIGPNTDGNFLVINNVTPNAYSYNNSSDGKDLVKDAYYKISLKVLTFGLKADENAYITLELNHMTYTFDEKVNTSKYEEGKDEALGEWTDYTFFVKTPDDAAVKDVKITLGLGKESTDKDNKKANFVQGYAFFDNVKFEKLDNETSFTDAVEAFNVKKIEATNADMLKPEEEKKPETEEKPKNDLLWVYITSGVLGGLTIIVVIAVVLKKYWSKIAAFFKKKSGKKLSEYDKNNPTQGNPTKKNPGKKPRDEFRD